VPRAAGPVVWVDHQSIHFVLAEWCERLERTIQVRIVVCCSLSSLSKSISPTDQSTSPNQPLQINLFKPTSQLLNPAAGPLWWQPATVLCIILQIKMHCKHKLCLQCCVYCVKLLLVQLV
jgi:hypothetical protein